MNDIPESYVACTAGLPGRLEMDDTTKPKIIAIEDALWEFLLRLPHDGFEPESLSNLTGRAFAWASWFDEMAIRLRKVANEALDGVKTKEKAA